LGEVQIYDTSKKLGFPDWVVLQWQLGHGE
jgi:hypothetical protein